MSALLAATGLAGMFTAGLPQQPSQPTPPWKGGLVHSLGQPARNYPFVAPMAGIQGATDGSVASGRLVAGVYRPVTNPLIGLFGLNAEAYLGLSDLSVEGGARLMAASHFLRVAGGLDLNGRSGDVHAIFSAALPIRRGGIMGSGSLLRIDWLPARSQLEVGISVPLHRNAGKTRPREDHVSLESPPPDWVNAGPLDPALEDVLHELRDAIRKIDLLVTPRLDQGSGDPDAAIRTTTAEVRGALPPNGEQGPPAVEQVHRYHGLLERAFTLASGDAESGKRIARIARDILLDDLLLPYNRLLGQRRSHDRLYRYQIVAWTSFLRSVRPPGRSPEQLPRLLYVFQSVLDELEIARQQARDRWDDGRLVWLPLQYALRPSDHDTQAELDSLIARAVQRPFTGGNRIAYVLADLFQQELQRTIRQARDYHVLWIHDFAGRNGHARPDSVSRDAVLDYLEALRSAVVRYDSVGRMPSYFIFLDQFYYQRSDSRLWMNILEDPLGHVPDPGPEFEVDLRRVRVAQRRLADAVNASSLLQLEARQYGKEWIPNLVKVHVSITNPPDRSFNSEQVLPFYGLPDDAIRDHRKVAFYDIAPADPARGEAVFTGAGVGDQYVGPGWEDRAVIVQGPANLHLRTAARRLLEVQQLSGRRLPWPFWTEWPVEEPAVQADGARHPGATARVLELHNETGYAPKELSVARAVLYTLMPPGSVVVVSGGLWGNYLTGSMLLGAALAGARVALLAPSSETTSNTGWPNMTRTWEMTTRLIRAGRSLAPELERAGGRFKIGIYDPEVPANDIHGRFRVFAQSRRTGSWLDSITRFHPRTEALIGSLDSVLAAAGAHPAQRPATPPPPKLHLKGEVFATGAAWDLVLGHPGLAPALRAFALNQVRAASPGNDGADLVRTMAGELADMLVPVQEDVRRRLPGERGGAIAWYLLVGSANQNNRSLLLDGEASVLLAGDAALQGLFDFIVLLGLCKWLDTPAELDRFIPPPGGCIA